MCESQWIQRSHKKRPIWFLTCLKLGYLKKTWKKRFLWHFFSLVKFFFMIKLEKIKSVLNQVKTCLWMAWNQQKGVNTLFGPLNKALSEISKYASQLWDILSENELSLRWKSKPIWKYLKNDTSQKNNYINIETHCYNKNMRLRMPCFFKQVNVCDIQAKTWKKMIFFRKKNFEKKLKLSQKTRKKQKCPKSSSKLPTHVIKPIRANEDTFWSFKKSSLWNLEIPSYARLVGIQKNFNVAEKKILTVTQNLARSKMILHM